MRTSRAFYNVWAHCVVSGDSPAAVMVLAAESSGAESALAITLLSTALAKLKFISLAPVFVSMMLPGLRSR